MLKLLSKSLPWHLSVLDILGIPEFHSHQEDPFLPVITEQKEKLSHIMKEHEKSIESCPWTSWQLKKSYRSGQFTADVWCQGIQTYRSTLVSRVSLASLKSWATLKDKTNRFTFRISFFFGMMKWRVWIPSILEVRWLHGLLWCRYTCTALRSTPSLQYCPAQQRKPDVKRKGINEDHKIF